MNYIKTVVPMKDFRLFVEMEGGSCATIDFTGKLKTMKLAELANEELFSTARTDGNYVFWGSGSIKLTVNELMDIIKLG